jgi:hypothetical protein
VAKKAPELQPSQDELCLCLLLGGHDAKRDRGKGCKRLEDISKGSCMRQALRRIIAPIGREKCHNVFCTQPITKIPEHLLQWFTDMSSDAGDVWHVSRDESQGMLERYANVLA